MSTGQITGESLKRLVLNAAGPGFALRDDSKLFYIVGRDVEVARIGASGVAEDPSVSGLPSHVATLVRHGLDRVKAAYHHSRCEPDGRGPYD